MTATGQSRMTSVNSASLGRTYALSTGCVDYIWLIKLAKNRRMPARGQPSRLTRNARHVKVSVAQTLVQGPALLSGPFTS